MKIYVGFSSHKGFAPLGRLIELCEGTNFSHAYLRVHSDSLDRELIYQATGSGVHFVGKTLFDQTAQVVEEYEFEITEEARVKLLQWAVDNAGKPYGRLQLCGIGIVRGAKLVGIKMKNPFSNGNKAYICCELVVAALESLGIAGPEDLDEVDLLGARQMVLAAKEKGNT